jgi:serine/threonine protein phosphatase PrpC
MIRDGQWQEILAPRTLSRLEKPTQRDSEVGQTLPLVALGVSDDVEPEIMEVRCQPGDVVILQSVGVRQPLREELVQNFLEQHHLIVRDESSLKNSIYENASLLLITFAAESTL